MIITLITIGILIGGIILVVKDYYNVGWRFMLGASLMTVGIIALIPVSVLLIKNQIAKDVDYQNALHKKQMLEYRIDNMEENIVGNEMLYNDIVEFNNELRSTKKWANNPWTNWFSNEDIATIEYIEIDKNIE